MNRFALILTTLVISGSGLRAASTGEDRDKLLETLQSQIASLETRVMQLEEALITQSDSKKTEVPVPDQPKTNPAPKPEENVAEKTEAPKKASTIYVIGEGDTISLIAKHHKIPREELMKANGLRESQQIYIGDSLIIPEPRKGANDSNLAESGNTKKDAKNVGKPSDSKSGTYTVRSGDTLTRIARNHSTTVSAIKSANSLKTDLISIGQKLRIPGSTSAPSSKTTLVSQTTTTPEAPKKDSAQEPLAPANTGELREGETYGLYTVEKGDTLYSLARDFFTSPAEIQRLNKLGKSNTIHPGQDLVVPTSQYYENHNQLAHN